jgi:hypothetical protein
MNSDDPEVRRQTAAAVERAVSKHGDSEPPRFVDAVPDSPLLIARYRKDYALDLVDASGWHIDALHPAERFIQHLHGLQPGLTGPRSRRAVGVGDVAGERGGGLRPARETRCARGTDIPESDD